MTILKFYDLQLPKKEKRGDGTVTWSVRVKRIDLVYYLRNDGSHDLANLLKNPTSLFEFDTEFDAHEHACNYYTKYKAMYPYFAEFMQATHRTPMPTAITATQTVDDSGSQVTEGSQVMTF